MRERQYEYLIGVLNINRCHEYINRCREYIICIQIPTYCVSSSSSSLPFCCFSLSADSNQHTKIRFSERNQELTNRFRIIQHALKQNLWTSQRNEIAVLPWSVAAWGGGRVHNIPWLHTATILQRFEHLWTEIFSKIYPPNILYLFWDHLSSWPRARFYTNSKENK